MWLAEIREACSGVSRHFDPAVYGVAEGSWTAGEIDDLVQDVTTEQLLKQALLAYIIDVASSIDDVRRLLRPQARRALIRRRRRTAGRKGRTSRPAGSNSEQIAHGYEMQPELIRAAVAYEEQLRSLVA